MLVGSLVSAMGSGATVPYLFAFLSQGRHLSGSLVGGLLTARAVGALIGAAFCGAWIDRIGVRTGTLYGLIACASSTIALLWVRGPLTGTAVLLIYGVVGAVLATAWGALLGALAPPSARSRLFAAQYALGNLGSAAGAAGAAGVLAEWSRHGGGSAGYVVLYGWDAATFVGVAVLIWRFVPAGSVEVSRVADGESGLGYRTVLGDRVMRRLCVLVALVVAAGYCQLQVGVPAFAGRAGLPASALGWFFAANTLTVVLFQWPVQRLSANWRRSAGLGAAVTAMVGAWAVLLAVGHAGVGEFVVVGAMFAVGEVFFAPVLGALVNDLARPELRGRYNGVVAAAWTGGWLGGTGMAGGLLAVGRISLLFPALTVLLLLAGAIVIELRRILPGEADLPPVRRFAPSGSAVFAEPVGAES